MLDAAVKAAVPVAPEEVDPKLLIFTVPLVTVKLWKGVVPPIALSKVTVPVFPVKQEKLRPAAFGFKVPVISIVPAPLLVERVILFACADTLPVKVMLFPVVVMPPVIWISVVPVSCTAPLVTTDVFWKIVAPDAVRQFNGVIFPINPSH